MSYTNKKLAAHFRAAFKDLLEQTQINSGRAVCLSVGLWSAVINRRRLYKNEKNKEKP